jgi:hypothetical protein
VHIEKIHGRKSKAIREMIDEPVIVEFKDGQIFGGNVDGYETGVFWLCDCKRLSKKDHEWQSHGIMTEIEGKKIEDSMPDFYINAVKEISVIKSEYGAEVSVEDALQFYIDPHHKPLVGVHCNGGLEENHAPECDAQLHNALAFLYTEAISGGKGSDKDNARKLRETFVYVRRRLLMYGAKIP